MSFHVHDLTIGPAGPQTPTVIAVHGITGHRLNWTQLAQLLGERFGPGGVRLLAPDLRGRGDSSIGPGPLGLAVHVQDLYTLATSLPQPPLMLGHSMGAAVCALLAAKHPEAIRGLVLVDGGVNFPVPSGMGDGDIDEFDEGDDWSYDAKRNSVSFVSYIPDPLTVVQISYVPLSEAQTEAPEEVTEDTSD